MSITFRCGVCDCDCDVLNGVIGVNGPVSRMCRVCFCKLQDNISLDGGVSSPSWQSIVDAHMESHERWRQRMIQLAKDICKEAGNADGK